MPDGEVEDEGSEEEDEATAVLSLLAFLYALKTLFLTKPI